jgi:hypothetical protein
VDAAVRAHSGFGVHHVCTENSDLPFWASNRGVSFWKESKYIKARSRWISQIQSRMGRNETKIDQLNECLRLEIFLRAHDGLERECRLYQSLRRLRVHDVCTGRSRKIY